MRVLFCKKKKVSVIVKSDDFMISDLVVKTAKGKKEVRVFRKMGEMGFSGAQGTEEGTFF